MDRMYVKTNADGEKERVYLDANTTHIQIMCRNQDALIADLKKKFGKYKGNVLRINVGGGEEEIHVTHPKAIKQLDDRDSVTGKESILHIDIATVTDATMPHGRNPLFDGMPIRERDELKVKWLEATDQVLNMVGEVLTAHDFQEDQKLRCGATPNGRDF